jgi:hypothetical protein
MPRPSYSRFITQTILDDEYRSLSSWLYSFLRSPVILSLLGPNILLNTVFSNIVSLRSSVNWATKFHTHTKQLAKLYFCIFLSLYCWIVNWKTEDSVVKMLKFLITWVEMVGCNGKNKGLLIKIGGLTKYVLSYIAVLECSVPLLMEYPLSN